MKEKNYYSSDVIAILKVVYTDTLYARRSLQHGSVGLAEDILRRQELFILDLMSIVEKKKPE